MAGFDEERFAAQQRARLAELLRVGLIAGGVLFPLFAVWETYVAGDHFVGAALRTRLVCGTLLLALVPLLRWPLLARRGEVILIAAAAIGGVGVAHLSTLLPSATTHAVGALALTTLGILVVATTFRQTVMALAAYLLAANLVLWRAGFPQLLEVDFFVGASAAAACLMALLFEHNARRAFQATLELDEERRHLQQLATIDPLTSVDNRRSFLQKGDYHVRAAQRYLRPLSLMRIDIDHFKAINDEHGHHVGDLTLRTLAQAVGKLIRTADVLGRIGGEEFGLVLPETDAIAAARLAERLRKQLEAIEVDLSPGCVQFTVSVGVTSISSKEDSLEVLLQRADRALFEAKRGGRNRVRVTT